MMYNCKIDAWGLFWARFGFLGNPFIALLGYYFVHQLLKINPVPHFKKLLVFAFISISLFNSDLIYAGIKHEFWGPYPEAGKLYFIYTIFFGALFFSCIWTLFVHMQKISNSSLIASETKQSLINKRQEIKYVLFAFILGSTGLIDFIAKYPVKVYPIGWFSALLFISLLCFAILKHQIQENELLRQEVAQTEQLKMVAALASSMAHEIKNPLTPIKTFTEQLPNRLNDKEFLLKFSNLINKEVDRIDILVQELLLFAKPSPPQLKKTNIHKLIEQSLELLKNQISNQQITLKTSFENKDILLNVDHRQIQQALLNILLNAIDAMPNGGTLTVIARSTSQRSEATKQSLTIEISDTGCGISPEDLKHIFEPFYTKKEKGTGLGLAITQGIIEKHGGTITVKSELGKGTGFTINL